MACRRVVCWQVAFEAHTRSSSSEHAEEAEGLICLGERFASSHQEPEATKQAVRCAWCGWAHGGGSGTFARTHAHAAELVLGVPLGKSPRPARSLLDRSRRRLHRPIRPPEKHVPLFAQTSQHRSAIDTQWAGAEHRALEVHGTPPKQINKTAPSINCG